MAEGVGFEPTVACATTVFKTVSLGLSDIPPESFYYSGKMGKILRHSEGLT